eukprot:TRINITY_DN88333_c0_g1_i1.p1 TRINITY_DN88333_c0_g1~~TRINITY_DN88333_c0_g1_i1.p1  ORF type:complete len:406 (+),score=68.18 TRINITY_DN88333_c0_g1_i1:53-1270(+)
MQAKSILATIISLAALIEGARRDEDDVDFRYNFATGNIDDYVDKKYLASGGMGTVYRATDHNGSLVVIKEAKHGVTEAAEALRQEAVTMKAVDSCPHVVKFVEAAEGTEAPFLVMTPFAPDGDLNSAKRKTSTGDWFRYVEEHRRHGTDPDGAFGPLKRIMLQVAEALACFADRGLVYSDLKAANLLIAPSEAAAAGQRWFDLAAPGREVLITDFGIAYELSQSNGLRDAGNEGTLQQKKTRVCGGTVTWMAPECLRPEGIYEGYVWSFDIFSFGAVSLALAGISPPEKSNVHRDIYDFWCDELANPEHLENALATDEMPFPGFYSRVGITDKCLREAMIRSLALDPTERIQPRALVSLLSAAGDETRCDRELQVLPPRPTVVPAARCKALFHSKDSLVAGLHSV